MNQAFSTTRCGCNFAGARGFESLGRKQMQLGLEQGALLARPVPGALSGSRFDDLEFDGGRPLHVLFECCCVHEKPAPSYCKVVSPVSKHCVKSPEATFCKKFVKYPGW